MEKKVYPDYDVIDGYDRNKEMEFITWIRKKNKEGVWYLIPVRVKYYFDKFKDISSALKDFHNSCYRTLMLYKTHKEGSLLIPDYPWMLCEEKDNDQRDEKYRLNRYLNINIKVL